MKSLEQKKLILDTFLKANKADKKFYANLADLGILAISIDTLLEDSLDEVIIGAFSWSASKQGHKFWSDLNAQWEAFVQATFA